MFVYVCVCVCEVSPVGVGVRSLDSANTQVRCLCMFVCLYVHSVNGSCVLFLLLRFLQVPTGC